MPRKWAIRLAIEGDLRFLSHHDIMRATERLLARSGLCVHYTQGFNPRAALSFAAPRPVGVASDDDLLVISLDEDISAGELLERFGRHCPRGMRPLSAEPLQGRPPRPVRAEYRTPLGDKAKAVAALIADLQSRQTWPVERITRNEPGQITRRVIDLRPLVSELRVLGQTLHLILAPNEQMWARPGEVLALLGLDERIMLARTVRTGLVCVGHSPGDRQQDDGEAM